MRPLQKPTVLFVTNLKSGAANKKAAIAAAREIIAQEYSIVDCSVADIGNDVTAAKLCKKHRPCAVIAVGGDGTVNACATAAVEHDIRLGVLPTGTFNHFAKHLNIPLDLNLAATSFIEEGSLPVDVGYVNGRLFVNFVSFGVYANIIQRRERYIRLGDGKWMGFFKAILGLVFKRHDFRLKIKGGGDSEFEQEASLAFIGNGSFEFGSRDVLNKRTNVDSGKLQVILLHGHSHRSLVLLAFLSLFRDIKNQLGFDSVHLEEVTVSTTKQSPVTISLDGEVISLRSPLRFTKRVKVLRVVGAKLSQEES